MGVQSAAARQHMPPPELRIPIAPAHIAPHDAPASGIPLRALSNRIQERLSAHREAVAAPGACLALILPGGEELSVCSGLSHRGEPDFPISSGDRMPSGSVGKTYCAALAMLLVQDGFLDLDAPISEYLGTRPWFARLPNADAITVRMVMNHTSGLAEHVTSPVFTAALRSDPDRQWTPEELIAFALDQPPLFPAGQGWSYADTNFVVLGLIIETITGRPYNELLRERLLEPLGLVWTDPTDRPDLWGLIPGYTSPDNPFGFPEQTADDETYCVNPQFEYTGGGTITTPLDLARWGDALYGGRVVSADSLAAMIDGVPCELGPGTTYGLGTIIWTSPHGPAIGHAGWFPGYVSMLCHYPDLGVTIAYQQNTDVRAGMGPIRRLMDAAAGLAESTLRFAPTAPATRPTPPEQPEQSSPAPPPVPAP